VTTGIQRRTATGISARRADSDGVEQTDEGDRMAVNRQVTLRYAARQMMRQTRRANASGLEAVSARCSWK